MSRRDGSVAARRVLSPFAGLRRAGSTPSIPRSESFRGSGCTVLAPLSAVAFVECNTAGLSLSPILTVGVTAHGAERL
jgi:hypothetical protein